MAIDEAQRQLDMALKRISNLGDPVAADDATKTDNATAPVDPGVAAAAGGSFKAAAQNHVHQGVHSIVAGTGITLAPISGLGDVTVNSATGGGDISTFGAEQIDPGANTRFLIPGYAFGALAPTTALEISAPRAGTLKNLFVQQNAAPGGANANLVSYRVRINGVDSLLVVSRAANAGIGQSSNLVNTVAVAQGDRIAVVAVKAVAIGSGVLAVITSMEFA